MKALGILIGMAAVSAFLAASAAAQDADVHIDHRSPLAPADAALYAAAADVFAFELSTADAASRDAAMCGHDFTMDRAMAGFAPARLPSWAAPESDRVLRFAVGYYQCLAYVTKDKTQCAPLKAFTLSYDSGTWSGDPDGGAHWDLGCFGRMNEIRLVRAFIAGGEEFSKLCAPSLLATQEYEDSEFANEDIERVCGIIVKHGRDPVAACKEIAPLYKEAEDAGNCVPMLRRLQGDPGSCEGQHSLEAAERCRAYVAFRQAYDARDPKRCGDQPICRILMGGGAESCRPYADSFQDLFCAAPKARAARLQAELKEADAALDAQAGSNDPALALLRKRRADLQSRYERIKKGRSDLGGGAPAGGRIAK